MVEGKTAQELATEIFWNEAGNEDDLLLTHKQIRRINKRLRRMVEGFRLVHSGGNWWLEATS